MEVKIYILHVHCKLHCVARYSRKKAGRRDWKKSGRKGLGEGGGRRGEEVVRRKGT